MTCYELGRLLYDNCRHRASSLRVAMRSPKSGWSLTCRSISGVSDRGLKQQKTGNPKSQTGMAEYKHWLYSMSQFRKLMFTLEEISSYDTVKDFLILRLLNSKTIHLLISQSKKAYLQLAVVFHTPQCNIYLELTVSSVTEENLK